MDELHGIEESMQGKIPGVQSYDPPLMWPSQRLCGQGLDGQAAGMVEAAHQLPFRLASQRFSAATAAIRMWPSSEHPESWK